MKTNSDNWPLCIDLDGTLINTDLLAENLVRVLKTSPWNILLVPFWLFRGKSYLKARLASLAQPDIENLPYNAALIRLVREARSADRRTVLVTGSHKKLAVQVESHLNLFDEVLASDDVVNLTGTKKAERLVERFGHGQFEYAGNDRVDVPVWESAGAIVTVNTSAAHKNFARKTGKPHRDLPAQRAGIRQWLKQIRLHQWAKNLLIFVPVLAAHTFFDLESMRAAFIAFICFGFIASATYLINDLMDLDADRAHKSKRFRPIAAGVIPIHQAVLVAAMLLLAGIILAVQLPNLFLWSVVVYLIATLSYSFGLKRIASLDIVVLAGLYTVRMIAGAFAVEVPLSFWLLAFSMFIFLCLAIIKRVAELLEIEARQEEIDEITTLKGREYGAHDIPVLQTLGAASGYLAVLVIALYINSAEVQRLYRTPELLWLIVPLALLWVTRIWIVTARGYMHEDPIVFAIKDPETWLTALVGGLIMMAATLLQLSLY